MLGNILCITVKTTPSPDKHSIGLSQTNIGLWDVSRESWSARDKDIVSAFGATHLPTDLKPEQCVIQTVNIKTLTRTSPKDLLLPRQWIQPAELAGPSWFCSAPDLPQDRKVLHKSNAQHGPRQTHQTTYSSPQPHSPATNRRTFYSLSAGHSLWLLGPNPLPSNFLFWSVWLPSPSFFSC